MCRSPASTAGLLDNRSFGGAQVSRTFYVGGQTGQQLLLGAYQQMARQVGLGNIKLWNRVELVDVVVVDGRCAGIVTRDLLTGEVRSHSRSRRRAVHRRLRQRLLPVDERDVVQRHGDLAGPPSWRLVRQPVLHADPPDVHPAVRRVPVEADADVRVVAQRRAGCGCPSRSTTTARRRRSPRTSATTTSNASTRASATSRPRDISSRAAKRAVDSGRGVGPKKNGVYLDFADAIGRLGKDVISQRYGNLFDMYERITGEDPYTVPMRIYPASHYTMGGLWVDYELMTTIPGLYCAGEANFSDHGANRLGASALMQGLADGYFVLPNTISNYLAPLLNKPIPGTDHPEFAAAEAAARERFAGYLAIGGTRSPDWFHRELGKIIWDYCGMERTAEGLEKAMSEIPALYDEFRRDLRVTGARDSINQTLEKAGRVDDFFQLGMLMCRDALERRESCGGHFRAEYQTEEGEALRDDDNFAHVAAWEWTGDPDAPARHTEQLEYEFIHFQTRSYK